jgi:hypothetical protein
VAARPCGFDPRLRHHLISGAMTSTVLFLPYDNLLFDSV